VLFGLDEVTNGGNAGDEPVHIHILGQEEPGIIVLKAVIGVQFCSSAATLKLCNLSSVAYSFAFTQSTSVHFFMRLCIISLKNSESIVILLILLKVLTYPSFCV
jgi:hypothetical protein